MSESALEPLDESWQRALVVVAHPDDLEYGAAAAVARWTAQDKHVVYCLITSGEAGIDGLDPAECGPVREQEQREAAAAVGVHDVEFLGFPDGVIEYGLPLRRAVADAVRRHRPDVVITMNHHDTWAPGVLNQADHIAVGRAVLDGVRDAGNRWVFRDLGSEPVSVHTVLVGGSPEPTHAVDVTDHFAAGVASLAAHTQYLADLGDTAMSDPEEFLESLARPTGARIGATYGVSFEVVTF